MTVVTYTSARSLLPGHTIDVVYQLPLRLISGDHTGSINKREQQALSGKREAIFWSKSKGMSVTIGSYEEISFEYNAVLEFLDSVEGGEPFTFDRWGSVGSPNNPQTAVMIGTYQTQRYAQRAGEGTDLMRFSFNFEFV
jgi:hypothetical protein